MADELTTLRAVLDDIARRRAALAWRRGWVMGALMAATALAAVRLAIWAVAPTGASFLLLIALGLIVAVAALVVALRAARLATTPVQVARLLEERLGGLDDVVVTAVDYAARDGHAAPVANRLATAALAAVGSGGADAVVAGTVLQTAGRRAVAAGLALAAELITSEATGVLAFNDLQALGIMAEFYVKHLPIVNNTQLLGLVSEDDLLHHDPEEPVGAMALSLSRPYVHSNDHFYEVLRMMALHHLSVIPVIDEDDNYLGIITLEDLLQHFARMGGFAEPGSIIVVEISKRGYSLAEIARAVRWAMVPAVAVAIALPLIYGNWSALTALGLLLATWIVCTAILNFVGRVQHTRAGRSFLAAALKQPRHFFGMHLAHIGIAVFVVGVTMVSSFQEEKDVKMAPGDSVDVAGYHFTFKGVRAVEGPNYAAAQGDFDLSVDGKFIRKMNPEKRNYHSSQMPMTEASIDAGILRDVYVSLGEPIDRDKPEGEWAVRVYYKPFVDWIWGGCVLMALGGLLAMLDRRYRVKARASSTVKTPAGTQQA